MAIPAPDVAARRTASLIVERQGLTPPVDVQSLLEAQIDLRRVDWPQEDVDAILTGLGQGSARTTVFIRATDNLLRERFTMGHEFGHLTLPWHLPAPNCQIGEGKFDLQAATTEQQADIFASCLLVPDRWLADLVKAFPNDMTRVLQELNSAEVTTAAALQALRRYLLPGWIFVAYGGTSIIATRGTNWTGGRGRRRLRQLESSAYEHGTALLNSHEVRWYKLSESASLPAREFDDDRSDHELLMNAIATITADSTRAGSIAASANGKVGGTLREAAGRQAAQTYEAMIHKLEDWDHAELLQNEDFKLWLAQRSRAIENGDTKRSRRVGR